MRTIMIINVRNALPKKDKQKKRKKKNILINFYVKFTIESENNKN